MKKLKKYYLGITMTTGFFMMIIGLVLFITNKNLSEEFISLILQVSIVVIVVIGLIIMEKDRWDKLN